MRFNVSGGGGGDYDCTVGAARPAVHDIGDRFGVPETWRCVAAWYHVSDATQFLSSFQQIDVAPRAGDVELSLKAIGGAMIQIAVSAAYEHD